MNGVTDEKEKRSSAASEADLDLDSDSHFKDDRGQWGKQLEFILTLIGYAVGLGNVWRFPYLCYKNGGGAFLIPYILMLIFCGLPTFFLEIAFGQFASLGPTRIWTVNPLFKGVGLAMVMVQTFATTYYQLLVTYILYFFFASLNSELPWSNCDNLWNTCECLTTDQVANETYREWYLNMTGLQPEDIKTPSEEYYYRNVLRLSEGFHDFGGIVWQLALCLFLVWTIVFVALIKGVGSLGKVVYFTTLFPYFMMTIMIIRGCTLEGAGEGLTFYLKPDLSKLGDSVVWSDAANQIFFSLSCCTGGLIAMASYNKFHNNVYRDGIIIPIINCATSLYVGFAIFSVLGYMALQKGVEVPDVVASGPGLIFVVYPEALATMPGAPIWSFLFFLMMLTLGFSSSFSQVESIYCALTDEFPGTLRASPRRQLILRSLTALGFFLISLPLTCNGGFYLFNIMDTYAGGLPRIFVGVFLIMGVIWIYGLHNFCDDICIMVGKRPAFYFQLCWAIITPVIIIAIIGFRIATSAPLVFEDYVYPDWANVLGWLMVAFCLIWIPIWWCLEFFRKGGGKFLKSLAAPTPEWGPANKEDQTGRYHPNFVTGQFTSDAYFSSSSGTVLTHRTSRKVHTDSELQLNPSNLNNDIITEKSSQL